MADLESWAAGLFGATELGDARRTKRLVAMALGAGQRPSGTVSSVYDRGHEREGAYDFLENEAVDGTAIAASVFDATLRAARGEPYVYVVVDGSSLTLADAREAKDFGPIGSSNCPARGIKVMSALAIDDDGVPLGLADQIFWSRPPRRRQTRAEAAKRNAKRAFEEKETKNFVDATQHAVDRFGREGVRVWAVIDREADNRDILIALAGMPCDFTVRSHWDRPTTEDGRKLRGVLEEQPTLGAYELDVGRTAQRAARRARIEVRAKAVELRFAARPKKPKATLKLTAVWFRELDRSKGALDWLLFTNKPVTTSEEAAQIVQSYRFRWRIEEFHRTWKSGECNVEDTQLRSKDAVVKWATILAAVATRIERLKYLSRSTPDAPATIELTELEIEMLRLDQRRRRPGAKTKVDLPATPTIREATHCIAELGGWMGLANGPPGAITLARGLDRLAALVDAATLLRQPPPGAGWSRT